MSLLYHAYVYLEFLILACTIYILAPICFKENSGIYATRGVLRGEKKCFVVHLFSDENAIKINYFDEPFMEKVFHNNIFIFAICGIYRKIFSSEKIGNFVRVICEF